MQAVTGTQKRCCCLSTMRRIIMSEDRLMHPVWVLQVYKDTAAKEAISLDSAPHGHKDFSLLGMPGSYR